MKTVIHINQWALRRNKKRTNVADYEPVVTVKDYKQNRYGFSVDIQHPDTGQTIARVVYSPHKPLKCGAVCWITSEMPVQVNTKLQ